MKRLLLLILTGILLLLPAPARAELSSEDCGQISEQMLSEIVKLHGQPEPVAREERAGQVFYSLAALAGRSDVDYRLEVVDDPTVNAYAMPDGRIVFFTGLVDALPEDDLSPLAFVAAHEIAHVEHRHAERLFQQRTVTGLLLGLLTRSAEDWAQALGGFAYNMLASGYSREMEAEADREAMALMKRGDYDPHGALVTLALFRDSEKGGGLRMFPTHPDPADRHKDAVAWVKANDPYSPLVLADLLERLRSEGRDADRVAQGLWQGVSNQPQAPGGADGEARVALLGLAESTNGLVGCLDRSLSVPHDAYAGLQEAQAQWAATRALLPLDAERRRQAADLEERLVRVQDVYLLAATRNTERLAQLLWKEGGQGVLGVAETAHRLRTGLESGRPVAGPALQSLLAEGQRWIAAGGPDQVPPRRRSEALALSGELQRLQGLRVATPPAVDHPNPATCAATLDGLAQRLWAEVRNQPVTPGDAEARRALLGLAEGSHNLVQGGPSAPVLEAVLEWERCRGALPLTSEQEHMAAWMAREAEHLRR